jgi:hypothetical protein
LIATAVLTFTQRIFSLLRENKVIEQELLLLDGSKKFEIGRVFVRFTYKAHDFETKVIFFHFSVKIFDELKRSMIISNR